MPAARHRSRSPDIACAVNAMIGTWPPVSRSRARIAAVASSPPISGIWTSIRIDVEWLCGGLLHGLTAVPDDDDVVATLLEQGEHELLIRGVVLRDQHAE